MLDLSPLDKVSRLLMTVPLKPVQGDRFQPTGFPSLGAAYYQTKDGCKLLVESAQSMANRLEKTCWDEATNNVIAALAGISHVTVTRKGAFLTDSMLEAHRLNSPYMLNSSDRAFLDPFLAELRARLGEEVVNSNNGLINRNGFALALVKFDIGSLIHGVFLSNKVKLKPTDSKPDSIAGGRLRVARALSAFIEASGVKVAASGGVKNDPCNPSGDTSLGFGNVPFARDEYVADRIDCHINLDLAQIRGYGLDLKVQKLLILLALYRVRKLLDGDLRLRSACDLEPLDRANLVADRPEGFKLPSLTDLESAVKAFITECKDLMVNTTVAFEDELKKAKDEKKPEADDADDSGDDEDNDTENDDN
ncbi:MAG: type I-U CRISPR-associated RAMP protein Csb1/Cas7u [Gemmataceae bacterium]